MGEQLIVDLKVAIDGHNVINYYGEYTSHGGKTAHERASEELRYFASRLAESNG